MLPQLELVMARLLELEAKLAVLESKAQLYPVLPVVIDEQPNGYSIGWVNLDPLVRITGKVSGATYTCVKVAATTIPGVFYNLQDTWNFGPVTEASGNERVPTNGKVIARIRTEGNQLLFDHSADFAASTATYASINNEPTNGYYDADEFYFDAGVSDWVIKPGGKSWSGIPELNHTPGIPLGTLMRVVDVAGLGLPYDHAEIALATQGDSATVHQSWQVTFKDASAFLFDGVSVAAGTVYRPGTTMASINAARSALLTGLNNAVGSPSPAAFSVTGPTTLPVPGESVVFTVTYLGDFEPSHSLASDASNITLPEEWVLEFDNLEQHVKINDSAVPDSNGDMAGTIQVPVVGDSGALSFRDGGAITVHAPSSYSNLKTGRKYLSRRSSPTKYTTQETGIQDGDTVNNLYIISLRSDSIIALDIEVDRLKVNVSFFFPGSTFPQGVPQKVVTNVCYDPVLEGYEGTAQSAVGATPKVVVNDIDFALSKGGTKVLIHTIVHFTASGATPTDVFKIQLYDVDTSTANASEIPFEVYNATEDDSREAWWLLETLSADVHHFQVRVHRTAGAGTVDVEADTKAYVDTRPAIVVESRQMQFLPGTVGETKQCEPNPKLCCPIQDTITPPCCPDTSRWNRVVPGTVWMSDCFNVGPGSLFPEAFPGQYYTSLGWLVDPTNGQWQYYATFAEAVARFPEALTTAGSFADHGPGYWMRVNFSGGQTLDIGCWVLCYLYCDSPDFKMLICGNLGGGIDGCFFSEAIPAQQYVPGLTAGNIHSSTYPGGWLSPVLCDSRTIGATFYFDFTELPGINVACNSAYSRLACHYAGDAHTQGQGVFGMFIRFGNGGSTPIPPCTSYSGPYNMTNPPPTPPPLPPPVDPPDSNLTACGTQVPPSMGGDVTIWIGGVAVVVGQSTTFMYSATTPVGYSNFLGGAGGLGIGWYAKVMLPCGEPVELAYQCISSGDGGWALNIGVSSAFRPGGPTPNVPVTILIPIDGALDGNDKGSFTKTSLLTNLVAGPCARDGDTFGIGVTNAGPFSAVPS